MTSRMVGLKMTVYLFALRFTTCNVRDPVLQVITVPKASK